ncbi:3-oxo-5-alpha-steroid 4-dehydrogenase [Coniochaeta sp. 2T2.1]|nr:3-oxo-5-alpha-steroid 4-dehydrogenase [Coniochaeta sp. 2T2.1]
MNLTTLRPPDWINQMLPAPVVSSLTWLWATAFSIPPAEWLQILYLVEAALILGLTILPDKVKGYLLAYRARASKTEISKAGNMGNRPGTEDGPAEVDGQQEQKVRGTDGLSMREEEDQDDWFAKLIRLVTSWGQIPHSWFGGFYVVSVAGSIFWLVQHLVDGSILHFLASWQVAASGPGMEPGQVVLLWAMMFLQGSRRLLESYLLVRPGSKSTMWIVHWLVGHVYYIMLSLTVWIEGSAILQRKVLSDLTGLVSPKTVIATLVYLFAAISQSQCHEHLAGLKKYSLPTRGAFQFLMCPHYLFECLLYLAMAVAGAPKGALCNRTLLCSVLFAGCNLGVTAGVTGKWYKEKFGADAVKKRWNMIPLVY